MLKAGRVAGFRQRHAMLDLVSCAEEAFCVDIFSDAVAGLFAEDVHEVAPTDKELF